MTRTATTGNGRAQTASAPPRIRVAIYTRKSVSEGLDQEFNTLDAQREAVEAYVQSQRGEGWLALPERYDDGGYTGSNLDRPGFQRLLADIEAGRVDVIGVYRLDRLTRSLADFARLMEHLAERGVAFVSVSERFDTSTPMGRMVLNLLATFAQFERETIAQRTKDKLRASRRRGMWTGGRVLLGYDLEDKRLVVNEEEAEQVRAVFALYLERGTAAEVAVEARKRGWRNKSWTAQNGKPVTGGPLSDSAIKSMLRHPVYIGMTRVDSELYEGMHDAIVDRETWDAAQALLAKNAAPATRKRRTKANETMLCGILHCGACGSPMGYHYTNKPGRTYGYYVCNLQQKRGAAACPGSRVAMGKLDAFVLDRLRAIGRDPAVLEATIEADRRHREKGRPAMEAEGRKLARKIRDLGKEENRLSLAIGQASNGSTKPLTDRLTAVCLEMTRLRSRHESLLNEIACIDEEPVDARELRIALAEMEPVWDVLFPRERARLVALLVERIEFEAVNGEVKVQLRPDGPRTLLEEQAGADREG